MSEHVVIKLTKRAIEDAYHPKGMSVHDGMVKIPACHADWMLKKIDSLEKQIPGYNVWKERAILAEEKVRQLEQELIERAKDHAYALTVKGRILCSE